MKKSDIAKALKDAWITFEIFWSKKDKDYSCYEIKLVKDENTKLWAKLDFNVTKEEVEDMIQAFNKFDYKEYIKSILHSN